MRHTLLLCFIHGFKGGADTFGANSQFSRELRKRVAHALPRVDVRVAVYPTYETRGDLKACVDRFIEWLQDKVIDLEVAAKTPSPTVDPSVHCILIGHSMGGIVAADALLAIVGDERVSHAELKTDTTTDTKETDGPETLQAAAPALPEFNSLTFPHIQGVLGCDTPYLGIAPGVVAHGAEGQYVAATAALAQFSGLTEALWGNKAQGKKVATAGALPQAPSGSKAKKSEESGGSSSGGAAAGSGSGSGSGSGWGWGKIAVYAGAGALAAGGAAAAATAAYRNREQITSSWSWATSHLEFVGCLARGEDLRKRMAQVRAVHDQLGVGFGNLYTRLGKKAEAQESKVSRVSGVQQRTFCNLPSRDPLGAWHEAVNDAATDETWAHMSMFDPGENPNYATLLGDTQALVVAWTAGSMWYASSTGNRAPLQVMQAQAQP